MLTRQTDQKYKLTVKIDGDEETEKMCINMMNSVFN